MSLQQIELEEMQLIEVSDEVLETIFKGVREIGTYTFCGCPF